MTVPADLRIVFTPDRIEGRTPDVPGVWWSPSAGSAPEFGTCGLPATARGFVVDLGEKRVTAEVTIGRNPGTGPKGEPRVGISRLVIEVEGDGVGEVLTQGEVTALPINSMLVETVRLAITAGRATTAMAEKLIRPQRPGGTRRGEASDRYRKALLAADEAERRGRTIWRAVAAACPRQPPPRRDGDKGPRSNVGGEAAEREAAKRLLSRARQQRADGHI